MPLVVRELIIRAQVRDEGESTPPQAPPPENAWRELVSQCVEQVLEILREREER